MATLKNKINVTPEMIQAVLSSMTVQDLEKTANEKKMESVQGDIDLYLKTDSEQTERLARIRSINADWKAPTQADRVFSYVTEKGASTKAEIIAGTGITSGIWLTLKKLQDDGRLKLDSKTEKYSVVTEEKK
jgi:hypothetical protein